MHSYHILIMVSERFGTTSIALNLSWTRENGLSYSVSIEPQAALFLLETRVSDLFCTIIPSTMQALLLPVVLVMLPPPQWDFITVSSVVL